MDTKKLRQKILDLAIHGKLVPQDPNDEPASVLLERIRAEKERMIAEGKIKRSKKSATSDKPHYENVPFEVPNGWCWCRLDEVADYGKCQTTSIEDIDDDSWILELEDIEKDSGKVLKRCTKAEREIKGVRHSFHKGNVLYSKLRTYLNKVLVADEDGFCTTEIMPIECGAYILPTYLCHVLRSKYFLDYTTQCGYGVKMPRLSTADACKAMIPVAPIEEQKRIAVMIENLDLLIDLLDENKQILQAGILQAKSKILDLAIHGKLVPQDPTDEPASELLKRINPKTAASGDNPHYGNIPNGWIMLKGKYLYESMKSTKPTEDFFKYIDIDSIDNKRGIVTAPKVLPSNNAPSRASRYTCQGDVLFSMVRPYLRNIAIVPENNCIASTGFFVCHPIPVMTSEFCYYLMKSSYIVDGLNQFMKGDNSPSINNANITEWIYPIPPIEEQNRIVQKIKELYGTIDYITEALL